jgi:hypothetical protein
VRTYIVAGWRNQHTAAWVVLASMPFPLDGRATRFEDMLRQKELSAAELFAPGYRRSLRPGFGRRGVQEPRLRKKLEQEFSACRLWQRDAATSRMQIVPDSVEWALFWRGNRHGNMSSITGCRLWRRVKEPRLRAPEAG